MCLPCHKRSQRFTAVVMKPKRDVSCTLGSFAPDFRPLKSSASRTAPHGLVQRAPRTALDVRRSGWPARAVVSPVGVGVNTFVHSCVRAAKHQHVRFNGETRDPVSNRVHYTSHMGSTRGAGVHLSEIPFAVNMVFTVCSSTQCWTERIDSA